MRLRAGELDRRITIQRLSVTRGNLGEELKGWTTVATVWAKVEVDAGGEEFRALQRTASQTARFTIRYRAGISPKDHRVVYQGRVYEIEDVAEPDRIKTLVLTGYARDVASGAAL